MDWTSNLWNIKPQICVLNLKFVEYWTSNLWCIEPQIWGGLNFKGRGTLLYWGYLYFFSSSKTEQICDVLNLKFVKDWTSNLLNFEPQIFGVLNLKFVVYWTSSLRWIELQICGVLNLKFVEFWTSNLFSIENQICWVLNLKFVEDWPQIC
jgi:hypothetical protein